MHMNLRQGGLTFRISALKTFIYGGVQCKTVPLMQRRSSDGLVCSGLELPVACQTKPSAGPLRATGGARLMAPRTLERTRAGMREAAEQKRLVALDRTRGARR